MFKLDFDIPSSDPQLTLKDRIYLIGSCFSDEIGAKLAQYKFNTLSNPFGTVYNPISIFKLLSGKLDAHWTTTYQDIHYHWDMHGEVSALSEKELMHQVEEKSRQSAQFLAHSHCLLITLGSAFIYRLKSSGEVVANCHRSPADRFTKELLSSQEIVAAFEQLNEQHLKNINVVFTVSPVRHIKDGIIENNHSKSVLIHAVRQITSSNENVSYFPSYEIMIDELRDYRFYKKDRVHPSEEAVDYIWNRFCETHVDEPTNRFIKSWSTMLLAIQHRPFHPNAAAHQKFLKETMRKLDQVKEVVD
ncbi:MAG: GSCFA domain-containing protein, partial [Bacteroidota bacterium]